MRATEWKAIARPILGEGWAFAGRLAYRYPFRWIVYGVLPEGSSYGSDHYVWAVRMPLYIPVEFLYLDWSERVGGGTARYHLDTPVGRQAITYAASYFDAEPATPVITDPDGENYSGLEARAYAFVLTDNIPSAVEILARVAMSRDDDRPFVLERIARARNIRELLLSGRTTEVVAIIEAWRTDAIKTLKLRPEHLDPS